MKALLPFLALLTLTLGATAKEGWETNFEKAKTQAQAQQKRVLLDFTGSDWCGWCMKLDKEVFSTPAWKAYAAKNLVQVEVDFPQQKRISTATKKQNEKLAATYGVKGYPTVIVLAPDGTTKKGQLGYMAGGPAAFIAAMEQAK